MLIGFILGVSFSFIVCLMFAALFFYKNLQFVNALDSTLKQELAKDLEKAQLAGSVNHRFKQLNKRTKKQLDLYGKLDTPSKGSSHSRWKKSIADELKALEDEKRNIFETFIEDDLDPIITVVDSEGQTKNVKISELLNEHRAAETAATPKNKSTDSIVNRDNSHLKLLENSDDENSTDNPSD